MQTRVLLLCGLLYACADEIVVHGQPEREANRIVLLLEHYGISAEKLGDDDPRHPTFSVQVASEQGTAAYALLEKFNLPRPVPVTTKDLVADQGLLPTDEQERARLELGLMGDIVDALLDFPLITDAHAAVTIPKKEPLADLDQRQPRPKASVVLEYLPSEKQALVSREAVQRFVQARLPEIAAEEVEVEMIPGDTIAPISGGCSLRKHRFGIDVCAEDDRRLLGIIIGAVSFAGVLAALTMFTVLRTMHYRRELTRLTQAAHKG